MKCFGKQMNLAAIPALLGVAFLFSSVPLSATIFGSLRGVVHDQQHRPIGGASVVLKIQEFKLVAKSRDQSGRRVYVCSGGHRGLRPHC